MLNIADRVIEPSIGRANSLAANLKKRFGGSCFRCGFYSFSVIILKRNNLNESSIAFFSELGGKIASISRDN